MSLSKTDIPSHAQKPLALLCGDPAGVGPEIIARWLAAAPENRVGVVPVGPQAWLDTLPVRGVAVGKKDFTPVPGQPDDAGQRVAWDALEAGAVGCREGTFGAVVTGPVNKARLAHIGYPFPGQTEFFADRWDGLPVMAFAGGRMKVVLATWHIPLGAVGGALTPELLERTVAAADFLARGTGAVGTPRIGVCGLNPHAGEEGLLGDDERDRLDPWLDVLRKRFAGLSRCQPGDTVFRRHLLGEFDVVVALYHDQGLAPLKTLEFEQSVNLTLGLRFLRTSPDHGTAYALAGTGAASVASWENAVSLARRLQPLFHAPNAA
ncbi:MAG: 4-hydroxythreonine-4-phosphate dehydrogenase PdxA [Puniceicoccales bacterium]|jgi:4-hydroxythreonine-4-phosphate dehydrogenase|nr:4-hydroxythreonine-4-phosphate dehydrogenase PdxA [Puniceicoccales bacterium]